MTKSALAIRHVHFETLGTFAPELVKAGYAPRYFDVGCEDIALLDPLKPDLLVVLGGPIGVYETKAYPFLEQEIRLLKARLDAGSPTLGICLGAQLIAASRGARVGPTGSKEIGFAPIELTEAGMRGPLRHLAGVAVLHWHGDGFDVPQGGALLATTKIANQAFALGRNVLALQFHCEADANQGLEAWLIGHAVELAAAGISPNRLRADASEFGPALRSAGQAAFSEWLSGLLPRADRG